MDQNDDLNEEDFHTEPCAVCGAPCPAEPHEYVAFCCPEHQVLYQVDNECREFVQGVKDYTDPRTEYL